MLRCNNKIHPSKLENKPEANLFQDFLRLISFTPFSQSMISNSETAGAGRPDFALNVIR